MSKTKLMQLDQQKVTLETILSLLPAQQHLHVAKFNPTVGHNPRFPPRDASCLPASEPQPVFESKRKGLSRVSKIVLFLWEFSKIILYFVKFILFYFLFY